MCIIVKLQKTVDIEKILKKVRKITLSVGVIMIDYIRLLIRNWAGKKGAE